MLYILTTILFLLPVIAGLGALSSKLFGNLFEGLSSKLFMGILSVSVVWLVVSFFLPLDIYVEVITLAVGFFAFFNYKIYEDFYKLLKEHIIYLSAGTFLIAFFASFFPFILDHFGYYVPTVKWLSEIGLVQGISNLDLILGQMSLWHIFQAGFSNFSDPFLRAGTLSIIVYLIYILEKKAWIHLCFIPVLFMFVQSPSPDLPVLVFSLILLNEIGTGNKNAALLFAFSIFIYSIKATVIWLPLLVFLYSVFFLRSNRKVYLPGLLLLFLIFFKNIWTFGYPVFPLQIGDLGFSWQPNPEIMETSAELAIKKTYDLQYEYEDILKFTWYEHIKNWFLLDGIKSVINSTLIVSMILFSGFTFLKRNKLLYIIYFSILIKTVLILLFSAQYRFFIDVFFVIAFSVFYVKVSKVNAVLIFSVLSIMLAVIFCWPGIVQRNLPSFRLGNLMGGPQLGQLYKPSYYVLKKYGTYRVGNLQFNIVKNYDFSFDTPIPAVSPGFVKEYMDAGIFPQLKGNTLKDGFIWRKISEDEKIYLKNILKIHEDNLKKKRKTLLKSS